LNNPHDGENPANLSAARDPALSAGTDFARFTEVRWHNPLAA
jgi:hypothetical protein